nr:hypothetical protein [Tanacetum cinerariifolium]
EPEEEPEKEPEEEPEEEEEEFEEDPDEGDEKEEEIVHPATPRQSAPIIHQSPPKRIFEVGVIEMARELVEQSIKSKTARANDGGKRKWDDNRRGNQGNNNFNRKINHQTPSNKRHEPTKVYAAAPVGPTDRKPYTGTLPYYSKCDWHHTGACAKLCKRCKKRGHKEKECRFRPTDGNSREVECWKCGAKGHTKNRYKMSRDVITVGSTMRIPLLYRGEYSQWCERFMNYLEEQTDGKAMINSIQNGDLPLPVIAQVSLAGTVQNAPPTLKDLKFWHAEEKKTRKINRLARSFLIQGLPNEIYSLIDSNKTAKDLCDALERQMRGSEYGEQDRKAAILYEYETFKAIEREQLLDTYLQWKQYAILTRQTKNLMDINIDVLYNIIKQNQGDVNDALGYKKKAIMVTSDPLALKQEFVKSDDKKEDKKAEEKKRDMSKVKCYNYKNVGHFDKDCKKAKDQAWMKSSSDSDQEINANMVFMALIEKVLLESDESSSSAEETIAESFNLNKDVKRYYRKDLLSCNNSHLGETSSASGCNDAMNVSCNFRMCDLLDDNNFFIFDDESIKISPVSKMPFRKKPCDSIIVRSKSKLNKSLPRTVHKWLPKLQPLAEPIAKWKYFSSSLNDDVQQSPEEVSLPQTNTQSISNNMIPNVDEATTSHNVFNERLEDAYFDASTSFHDPSNVHSYYQPYPHEKKWTKDHPLHKIIGDPKLSVRTRGQLEN